MTTNPISDKLLSPPAAQNHAKWFFVALLITLVVTVGICTARLGVAGLWGTHQSLPQWLNEAVKNMSHATALSLTISGGLLLVGGVSVGVKLIKNKIDEC